MNHSSRVFVPADTAAVAVGANDIATAIQARAAEQQLNIELIRNGSRGMLWLETLVEIEGPEGRVAYGPVTLDDLDSLFEANWLACQPHPLCHGLTEDIPYLKNQERLTFARVGITDPLDLAAYQAHGGFEGLNNALAMSAADIVKTVTDSGLRGRGGAAFPTGIKWNTVLQAHADQKFIVCNADEGDSGTFF